MYKGKISYWITIIFVVLCIQFCFSSFFPWVGRLFHKDDITIYASTNQVDPTFFEEIGGVSMRNYRFLVDYTNPDIYFNDNGVALDKEGYVKYSKYLYSPLVLYLRFSVYENNSGFTRLVPDSGTSSPLQIDLYTILEGIEQGKNWEDIGVSSKVVGGPIILTIPNSRNSYYNAVVDLFYMTLNNLKEPTDEEYIALTPRVNNILSKCEQISDISEGILKEYSDSSENYKAFIGPEYLVARSGIEMGRGGSNQYNPIYFLNTIFLKMDMYVSENIEDSNHKEVVYNAIQMIESKNNFYNVTGWRVEGAYLNLSNVSLSRPSVVIGY